MPTKDRRPENRKKQTKRQASNTSEHFPPRPLREEATVDQIEAWARIAADSGGSAKPEAALCLLLDAICYSDESSSMALIARNAAFGAASSVIDDAFAIGMQPWRKKLTPKESGDE